MVAPIERQDLITELHRLADDLDGPPTARDMKSDGKYSIPAYYREFDSWNEALETANLQINKTYGLSRDELVNAVANLADELGYTPTREDMEELGPHWASPYYRVFESWNEALRAADLEPHYQRDATRQNLLDEIDRLATRGVPPSRIKMGNEGKFSPQFYYSEFGSWTDAVREAWYEPRAYAPGNRREFDYGQGWNEAKREIIRTRDSRECQHCGMKEDEQIELYGNRHPVHHLIKAEKFDSEQLRNDPRNLVTLCTEHHNIWESADDYCPFDQSLPSECAPTEIDPYIR